GLRQWMPTWKYAGSPKRVKTYPPWAYRRTTRQANGRGGPAACPWACGVGGGGVGGCGGACGGAGGGAGGGGESPSKEREGGRGGGGAGGGVGGAGEDSPTRKEEEDGETVGESSPATLLTEGPSS